MGSTAGKVTVENKTGYTLTICIKSQKNQKILHDDTLKGYVEYEQKIVKSWTSSSPEKLDLVLKKGKCKKKHCSAKPDLSSEIYIKDNPYFIIKMSKDDNYIRLCRCKDGNETTVSTHPTKG